MKRQLTRDEILNRFLALKVDQLSFSDAIDYFKKDGEGISQAMVDFGEFLKRYSNGVCTFWCSSGNCLECNRLRLRLELYCSDRNGIVETIRLSPEQASSILSLLY